MEGANPESIGIVASALYIGILLGSLQIDRWITKVGHIRSFISFAILLASLVLLQSLWINIWYWSLLRLLGGIATAGVFIVIESWLLMESTPKYRGVILSVYLAFFYAALSLGQFLIDLADPMGPFPFFITATFLTLSILPVLLHRSSEPKLTHQAGRLTLTQMYRISPHGFLGGVISGMLLAAVYGLVPVYAKEMGMSLSEIGTFMAILIFGGFSLQLPVGRLADKTDRRRVLNIASFSAASLAIAIALLSPDTSPLLFALAWLFGGFSFTLYPLSMACACEKVKDDQIVAATGGFVLSYGIGAIAGPLLAPLVMALLGSHALFYFLALISLILGLIGLRKQTYPDNAN
jgi:MFS family permease